MTTKDYYIGFQNNDQNVIKIFYEKFAHTIKQQLRAKYSSLLSTTYTLVSQNQFQLADEQALQILNLIQTTRTDLISEGTKDIFEQAQWLHTVCVMNTGKVFKAKKLLRQIANSDSHYATRAQYILDKL